MAQSCRGMLPSAFHCRNLPFVMQTRSLGLQVVLRTTAGDIDIELWPKEAPKVCSAADLRGSTAVRHTLGNVVLLEMQILTCSSRVLQAVRNFVQLCLEGFYDGCAFHRVLKDFLVQVGSPNGSKMQRLILLCPAAPRPISARFDAVDRRALLSLMAPPFLQTGDPTGTGTGSETIYGSPFKDEFHSRLRFSHRCRCSLRPYVSLLS